MANRFDTRRLWMQFAGPHRVRKGAGTRRPGRQAPRQPVRSRPAVGCLAENACQPRAGVRDWRLHSSDKTFDALIFGYYEGGRLIYAARTRNGFTPVVREQLFKKFRGLEIKDCPVFRGSSSRQRAVDGVRADGVEDEDCAGLSRPWSLSSSSWSGRGQFTCGTPRSLRCATTSWHAKLGGSSQEAGATEGQQQPVPGGATQCSSRILQASPPAGLYWKRSLPANAHGRNGSGTMRAEESVRRARALSDRSTLEGLTQFLTQFGFAGSSTSP